MARRLAGWKLIGSFLIAAGYDDATRDLIQGDASGRRYERLSRNAETAILMIAPPRVDLKPIRQGRTYLQIAKLSETAHAFAAVAIALRDRNFVAPRIIASDLDAGLLIAEDLGGAGIVADGQPIGERYAAVAETLADLHAQDWPSELRLPDGRIHRIQSYDLEAYLVEAELMLDWYIPPSRRGSYTGAARARFVAAWTETLADVLAGPRSWTLRDVHSPNILWQAAGEGRDRVGFIDIQDTLMGHPAYDVASLAQDARVSVPVDLERLVLAAYIRRRKAHDPGFDHLAFLRAYVVLASQRATKILGIFTRLDERDGKPEYRRHLPRIEAYLRANLGHPAMAAIKTWMQDSLPGFLNG
jgi:N-acetylmuramate 1-kinase